MPQKIQRIATFAEIIILAIFLSIKGLNFFFPSRIEIVRLSRPDLAFPFLSSRGAAFSVAIIASAVALAMLVMKNRFIRFGLLGWLSILLSLHHWMIEAFAIDCGCGKTTGARSILANPSLSSLMLALLLAVAFVGLGLEFYVRRCQSNYSQVEL